MRPLIHFEFSSLGTYIPFTKSSRGESPQGGDEETGSRLTPMGKLCEKPYDGSCCDKKTLHFHHEDVQHPARPSGRSQRDNRTHRSRIERYNTDNIGPRKSRPLASSNQRHAPKPKPRPEMKSSTNSNPRSSYRLSAEEMGERYKLWYQGRGSEIGRGLWGVEILPSRRMDLRPDTVWETENRNSYLVPPKSKQ